MAVDRHRHGSQDGDARDAVAGDLEDEIADPDMPGGSEEQDEGPQVSEDEGLP